MAFRQVLEDRPHIEERAPIDVPNNATEHMLLECNDEDILAGET